MILFAKHRSFLFSGTGYEFRRPQKCRETSLYINKNKFAARFNLIEYKLKKKDSALFSRKKLEIQILKNENQAQKSGEFKIRFFSHKNG